MDDSVCTVRAAAVIARFFRHETCGQCTQCREGTQGSVNEPREREEHGMPFNEKWTYRAPGAIQPAPSSGSSTGIATTNAS